MPFIIGCLFAWLLINEYRDNGWYGVAYILIGGLVFAIVVFAALLKLLDVLIRKHYETRR